MGSSGGAHSTVIQSGGRLLGRQVNDILEGRVVDAQGETPARIVVLPNNKRSHGREGFIVDMTGADQSERQAFLRMWRGRANTDNSDAVWRRIYNLNIQRGASDVVARNRADVAKTRHSRDLMRNLLNRDADSANPKFPNVTIKRNDKRYYR